MSAGMPMQMCTFTAITINSRLVHVDSCHVYPRWDGQTALAPAGLSANECLCSKTCSQFVYNEAIPVRTVFPVSARAKPKQRFIEGRLYLRGSLGLNNESHQSTSLKLD